MSTGTPRRAGGGNDGEQGTLRSGRDGHHSGLVVRRGVDDYEPRPFVAEAPDLDVTGKIPDAWRGPMSLRWVLVHMVEEYARHNGHADLLRERIDGAVGQ